MPSYREQVDILVEHHFIDNSDYIVPGHSKVKPKYIIPLGPVALAKFNYNIFLFQFSPQGIIIFALDDKNQFSGYQTIYWKDVTKFKVRSGLLENTMILKAGGEMMNFKLTKRVIGSPWVNDNIERLSACNYFYNNTSSVSYPIKEEVVLPEDMRSEDIIIYIAECIGQKNQEVISALKLCLQYPESYKPIYFDGYRGYMNDEINEGELQWFALEDILSKSNYVCELDYKCELDDFLYNLCKLKGMETYHVTTAGIVFNQSDCIADWCAELDRAWSSQGICIASMDMESDSYVIFPTTVSELAHLKKVAERIGKVIDYAEDM